jgi:hypothetical protein
MMDVNDLMADLERSIKPYRKEFETYTRLAEPGTGPGRYIPRNESTVRERRANGIPERYPAAFITETWNISNFKIRSTPSTLKATRCISIPGPAVVNMRQRSSR